MKLLRPRPVSLLFGGLVSAGVLGGIARPASAQVFRLEGATFTKTDTYTQPVWNQLTFQSTFDDPVVFLLPNKNGSNPADFRMRNLTTGGFETTIAEPPQEDGPHIAMDVAYVAVELGQWTLPNAVTLVAGRTDLTALVSSAGGSPITVNFPGTFTNPVVIAQIQGDANETGNVPSAPSVPWLSVTVTNVTATSFDLALEGSECTTVAPALDETVGWLVMEGGLQGSFTDDDQKAITFETIATGATIQGWDDGDTVINFVNTYPSAPLLLGQLQTRNEADGGWLRYSAPTTTSVELTVDEDRCVDGERNHAAESAAVIAFSESFRLFDADPDDDLLDSPPFGTDNCPNVFNPNQTDTDGDGQGDACDPCGNAVVDVPEACDDGNLVAADGCESDCSITPGWECPGNVCSPICGDGLVVGNEICDGDGNGVPGETATCDADCTAAECGDGVLNPTAGEACDDGNLVPNDGCSALCTIDQNTMTGTGGSGGAGVGGGGASTGEAGGATSIGGGSAAGGNMGPGVGTTGVGGMGAGANDATFDVEATGGCSCRLGPPRRSAGELPAAWFLLGLVWVVRRRRWRS
ncbi:MAG: DUF4215 domain-containing protein [Myxococcota bacterium]